jgi:hypothetical protein
LTFSTFKGLNYWNWRLLRNRTNGPLPPVLKIRRGQYSPVLMLSIDQNFALSQRLVLNLINYYKEFIRLEIVPKDLVGEIGSTNIQFRFGVPIDSVPGTYELFWSLQQNLPEEFAVPDPITIQVVDEPIVLPSEGLRPRYDIVELGLSENIVIDMTDTPPMKPIYIDLIMPFYPDVGIDYGLTSRLTISLENPVSFTYLQSAYFFSGMQRSTYFYLEIAEVTPNRDLYRLPTGNNSYQINVFTPLSAGDYLLDVEARDPNTNNITLRVTFSQSGFIYYNIFIARQRALREDNTAEKIRDRLRGNARVGGYTNNITHETSGMVTYFRANTKIELPLIDLIDNTEYVAELWGVDARGNFSRSVSVNFKTRDIPENFLARVAVYSAAPYSRTDLEDLACAFSDYFKLTAER